MFPKIVIFSNFLNRLITSFIIKIEINWKHINADNFPNAKILRVLPQFSFYTSYISFKKCDEVRVQSTNQNGGEGVNTTSNFISEKFHLLTYITCESSIILSFTNYFLNLKSCLPN